MVTFVTIFRVSSLISRANLILLTFIIPLILLIFRNSEFLSSLLGRSITNESFITINLEEDSVFRNLRIATFREEIKRLDSLDIGDASKIITTIDKINKDEKINLIILNIGNLKKLKKELETYLININKKILIISKNEVQFNNYFISRTEIINNYFLTFIK